MTISLHFSVFMWKFFPPRSGSRKWNECGSVSTSLVWTFTIQPIFNSLKKCSLTILSPFPPPPLPGSNNMDPQYWILNCNSRIIVFFLRYRYRSEKWLRSRASFSASCVRLPHASQPHLPSTWTQCTRSQASVAFFKVFKKMQFCFQYRYRCC